MTHAGRAASSPEIFRPFLTVCLTVFPFEFRPRTFTIGFYGKKIFHIRAYDFGVQFSFNWKMYWRDHFNRFSRKLRRTMTDTSRRLTPTRSSVFSLNYHSTNNRHLFNSNRGHGSQAVRWSGGVLHRDGAGYHSGQAIARERSAEQIRPGGGEVFLFETSL